jgi:hypothetical protein
MLDPDPHKSQKSGAEEVQNGAMEGRERSQNGGVEAQNEGSVE